MYHTISSSQDVTAKDVEYFGKFEGKHIDNSDYSENLQYICNQLVSCCSTATTGITTNMISKIVLAFFCITDFQEIFLFLSL